MWVAMHVWGQEIDENLCTFSLNLAVNLKLLLNKSIKNLKNELWCGVKVNYYSNVLGEME